MKEQDKMISDELALAGTSPELIAKLKRDRITADQPLPPMDFLMTLFDVPCFPRGELVCFSGKAKSGKTFVMTMLMAACAASKCLAFSRTTVEPLRMLWFDTEQSDQSTQDILRNRLMPMVGDPFPDGLYDIFNVRCESWKERLPLLLAAIDLCRPDLVILDGVRDLVDDINDGRLAHEVAEKLMKVAQTANCCIVCVIHQNKAAEDKTLRGSIGTELTNKAYEVYECEKLMPARTFVLTQKYTRKYDVTEALYYTVDESGLPVQAAEPSTTGPSSRITTPERLKVFADVLSDRGEMRGSELRDRVIGQGRLPSVMAYNELLAAALNQGILKRRTDSKRHVYYMLNGAPG